MPLFYFDTDIGATNVGLHGVELVDIDAARRHAADRTESVLRDGIELSSKWHIRVSDETGLPLFSISARAGVFGPQ